MADPTTTGLSRIFLIDGRARGDHQPSYESCIRLGAPAWGQGDITKIECPDPARYGAFIEIGVIQAGVDRVTTTLEGRYFRDQLSTLLDLARKRCALDVQAHFGACEIPYQFNTGFTKILIFEDAYFTNYSTDDMGTLESDGNAVINEMVDVSARDMYELMPITFAERGQSAVTNPLNDVVICSEIVCEGCPDDDSGCDVIYAVGESSPGSPGTAPDVIYTSDKTVTIAADEITTLTNTDSADGVACLGDYVIVISTSNDSHEYKLKATLNAGTAAGWMQVAGGYVGAGSPNDIWSVGDYAFIVGDGGYVYGTADASVAVTVLDAGAATTDNLVAVHALTDKFAVAVGENGAVVYTENRTVWGTATAPSANTLNCVWCKSMDEWWVGDSAGDLYYTLDRGTTWTEKAGLPITTTAIYDIQFPKDSEGFLAATIAGPAGRILRSYDGGYSWVVAPENYGSIPANDQITAIAACKNDPNFIVGVGTADNATDGIYVVGSA